MPTPLDYSYRVVKPFAYENTTPPVHQKSYVNSIKFKPTHTLSGAASGGSVGGVYGAAAGAAVGLASDIWQAIYAKKRAKEANEEARRAADVAAARSSQEARAARAYNSEQSQIRRMRMAGLSPGLAYGQMSPSSAVAAPQDKAEVYKSDTPKFDNESILHALQLLINQQNANTQQAQQISTSNLQDTQATLNRIEQGYKAQLGLAEISSLLANKDLTDEQKLSLIAKRMPEIQLLQSQSNLADANARSANANANVVENTGIPLANSQIAANTASAALSEQQKKSLSLTYDIDAQEWKQLSAFLDEYGYGEMMAPIVLKAVNSLANNSGQTMNTILNNLTQFSGKIGDWVMDYLGLNSEFIETDSHSYDEERGRDYRSGHESHTRTKKRK